jgi:hypothetical protein
MTVIVEKGEKSMLIADKKPQSVVTFINICIAFSLFNIFNLFA